MSYRYIFLIIFLFFYFNGGTPAFRDCAHFYRPLFWYICGEITAGRLPLWNPYENLGQPLAAEPTSLCFYPVMILSVIATVIGIDRDFAFSFCIAFHVLLATVTCYRFIRINRFSHEAAVFAALSYALGGTILFQWNNLPFLIGAAWLPEALRQAKIILDYNNSNSNNSNLNNSFGSKIIFCRNLSDQFSYKKSVNIHFNIIALAAVLSMMILGGDPQSVYNVVLCIVIIFFFSCRYCYKTFIYFLIAGIFTFMFSAILILPATEFWQLSDRTLPQHNLSVEFFSFHPLRVLEFLFTGISGKLFPINFSLSAAFLNEKNLWTPSTYVGLLPAIFALCSVISAFVVLFIAFRKGNLTKRKRYKFILAMFTILILFLTASFGNNFFVYDLLRILPVYNSFRYPSKLLILAALAISFFAAAGFDTFRLNKRFAKFTIITTRIIVTLYISFIIFVCYNDFPKFAEHPLFGFFDSKSAKIYLINSLITVTIIWLLLECIYHYIFINCIRRFIKLHLHSAQIISSWFLIFIVTIDLFITNSWLMISLPFERNIMKSAIMQSIESDTKLNVTEIHSGRNCESPIRVYRIHTLRYPAQFMSLSSANRFEEIIKWEELTLYPRYSLVNRVDVISVRGSMMHKYYYEAAAQLAAECKTAEKGSSTKLFERHLEQLGVQYIIAESNSFADNIDFNAERIFIDMKNIAGAGINFPINISVWRLRNPVLRKYVLYEPNRIVFDVEIQKELETIVLSEQFWSGWRAFDGEVEIQIKSERKIFRSIELPRGKHRITMIYIPFLIKVGGLISIIGVVSAIIFLYVKPSIFCRIFRNNK
ncbi:MAG: YfhO family protein [Planctomycetaceae bacterium]|nr:YfhO family protein [Planctomycetaceae bacterium]